MYSHLYLNSGDQCDPFFASTRRLASYKSAHMWQRSPMEPASNGRKWDRQSSMLQASWHAVLKAFGLLKSLNFFISDRLERWQVYESIGAAGQKRWHVPIHWFLIKFGLNIIERSFPRDKRLSGEVAWSPIHAGYVCEGFRYQLCWIFFCRSTGHVRYTEVFCGSACPQRRQRCTGTSWRQDKMWREAEFRITCTTLSKFREGQIFRGYCRTLFLLVDD